MKALNTKMLDDQDELILESNAASKLEDEMQLAKELDLEEANHCIDADLSAEAGLDATAATSIMSQTLDGGGSNSGNTTNSSLVRGGGREAGSTRLRSKKMKNPSEMDLLHKVECDDDFFEETSSPALARELSTTPQNKFRRFHSNPGHDPGPSNVSLMDELAGSLPCLDKSKALPFPEAYTEYSGGSSDDDGVEMGSSQDPMRQYQKNRFANPVFQRQAGLLQRGDHSPAGHMSCGESEFNSMNTRSSDYGATSQTYVPPLSKMGQSNNNHNNNHNPSIESGSSIREPERVFKVIFIGDSSVGKSSLITRFCTGKFQPGLKSTIGVDFHTRSLIVESQSICLQCWDTAGQERYRSITRQYFRKADAVVVMYDISSEKSFLNARDWLESAVAGAGTSASLLLLGNKLDIAEDDLLR